METDKTLFELYQEMLKKLGFDEDSYGGSYLKLEGNKIVTYTDVSYHGIPYFQVSDRKEISPYEAALLKQLLDMEKIFEVVSGVQDLNKTIKGK